MSIVRMPILIALLAAISLRAESPAEQKVLEAIKTPDLTVIHLWAPWCSNCQAELKSGGWAKIVRENPNRLSNNLCMTEISAAPSIAHNKPPAILSLIGDTPLVQVTQFDTGPCQLFLKLENQNPGGSIKDRIALSMIEAAEAEGHLQPGGTVVEATAGNTGLGLALVAGAKGYDVLLVIPDQMSREK